MTRWWRGTSAWLVALLVVALGHVSSGAVRVGAQAGRGIASGDQVRVGVLKDGRYEVVALPMDTYVARVLAGEAAPDSRAAALEALAIAIRTYTTTNRGRHGADGFDLCDQTHCQVMRSATAATEQASQATSGQVLLYRGEPATVYYSASCGGRSEKPSNVWPGAEDPPYLSIHDDDGCEGFPQWTAELAAADLQRALVAAGYRGTLRDVRIVARNDAGRVQRLALDGMTPREISGQDLRMVAGRTLGFQHLQSTSFDLRRSGTRFRFTGHGAGHGVGLCVIGSMKLAAAGQPASRILARYFPGTEIGPYSGRLTRAVPSAPLPSVAPGVTPGSRSTPRPVVPSVPPVSPPAARSAAAPSAPPAAAPSAPAATSATGAAPRGAGPADAVPADVSVIVPGTDVAERATFAVLVGRERDRVAQALGVAPPRVTVRVHGTAAAFEAAAGRPSFVLGAVVGGEIHLAPLSLLQARGMVEGSLRHQLVHLMADAELPERPAWIREGAAVYFSTPDAPAARPPCPTDAELERPVSLGALADAYARSRACFERQVSTGRDWRRVR